MEENYGEYNPNEERESKFNMAVAMLQRVDTLFYKLEESMMLRELTASRMILSSIINEVDCFFTDKEREEIKVVENKIDTILNKFPVEKRYPSNNYWMFSYPNERSDVTLLLIELNRLIRQHMFTHNLISPPKEDSALF